MIDDEKQLEENKSNIKQTLPKGLISLSQLMNSEVVEREWIVDGLLTTGMTMFIGDQKTGKSILTLLMAIAVATGEKFLDEFPTKKGAVVYLSLEDGEALIKERLEKMLGNRNIARDKIIDLFIMTEYKNGNTRASKMELL